MMLSEFDPVIQTSPVLRFTLRAYGSSLPVGCVGSSYTFQVSVFGSKRPSLEAP